MLTVAGMDKQDSVQSLNAAMVANKKERIEAVERATKIARLLLGCLLLCDFGLTIALIVQPLNDDQTTFEESEDLQRAIIRMATSSVTAALTLVSLIIVFPRFNWGVLTRMIVLLILRVLSIIFLVAELAFPTPIRTALNATILGLILLELLCIIFSLVKTSKISRQYYIKKERGATVGAALKSASKDTELFIGLLDDWLLLLASRKVLYKKYITGRNVIGIVSGLIFIVVIIIFVAEFSKVASTQQQLYSESLLTSMNSQSKVAYYNSTAATAPRNKVLVMVLDGLRYDYTEINDAFREFLASPDVAPHAKLYRATAQLPSMSVPNWMSILTGAPPESTGVLGNLLTPETPFDTIFREAANFGLERGLTGSPWFSGIIKSTLPFLGGDSTIATTLGGAGHSADVADDARARVLQQALTSPLGYKLFLAHFSDIDIQGHCCGVDTKWNIDDTYVGAVTNKTKILNNMANWVDNDTVVFIIADHGHVMRGGHGGVDPILTEIPLIIYKKDSNFANVSYSGPRFEQYVSSDTPHDEKPQLYTNLDVAPTVCAILGIPVPRQNQGKFIDDAMVFVNNTLTELSNVYYDLYMQKRDLVQAFIETTAPIGPPALPDLGPDEELSTYVSTIQNLIYTRDVTLRDNAITVQKARNIVVSTILVLIIVALFCFLLQATTMCDVTSIFTSHSPVSTANRKACLLAFLSVLLYYGICIAIYNICFTVVGYQNWDSTVIHTPEVLPRYAYICLLPAVIGAYVIIRAVHIYYSEKPKYSNGKFHEILNVWLLGKDIKYIDLGLVYLYRYYLLFWVISAWLILLILQSNYTFVVSPVFQLKFITSYLWELRFRIITVQFISLPLSLASFLLIFILFPTAALKYGEFDSIYMIKIFKEVYRSSGADKVTLYALSQLANGVYYSALWKEVETKQFLQVTKIDDLAQLDSNAVNGV